MIFTVLQKFWRVQNALFEFGSVQKGGHCSREVGMASATPLASLPTSSMPTSSSLGPRQESPGELEAVEQAVLTF